VYTYAYDPAGRLTALTHTHNRDLLARYHYTLDATGNRTRVTETVSGVTREISYTYDALYRLTAAAYSTGEAYAYQYDSVGNREVMTDAIGIHTYTYDAANRLTSIQLPDSSIQAYTWDNRGNLLADGTFTYAYSAAGRMVRAESITATLVYTYNADGLRVARSQSVESVDTFTWDWATPVPELLSDGDSLNLIGYDTLGWQRGADWTFVLPDALGSVRQETDAAGAVTAAREWSPYGEELALSEAEGIGGAQAGLGFTGEWFDTGVGLQYLRARWYDDAIGRFTSPDSIVPDFYAPQNLNDYAYVLGNPLMYTDPTGYIRLPWWLRWLGAQLGFSYLSSQQIFFLTPVLHGRADVSRNADTIWGFAADFGFDATLVAVAIAEQGSDVERLCGSDELELFLFRVTGRGESKGIAQLTSGELTIFKNEGYLPRDLSEDVFDPEVAIQGMFAKLKRGNDHLDKMIAQNPNLSVSTTDY